MKRNKLPAPAQPKRELQRAALERALQIGDRAAVADRAPSDNPLRACLDVPPELVPTITNLLAQKIRPLRR